MKSVLQRPAPGTAKLYSDEELLAIRLRWLDAHLRIPMIEKGLVPGFTAEPHRTSEINRLRRRRGQLRKIIRAHDARRPSRATALRERFLLSELEEIALWLAAAPDLDPKYVAILAVLQNEHRRKRATPTLARELLDAQISPTVGRRRNDLLPGGRLERFGLLEFPTPIDAPDDSSDFLLPMRTPRRVLEFLTGRDEPPPLLRSGMSVEDPRRLKQAPPLDARHRERLAEFLAEAHDRVGVTFLEADAESSRTRDRSEPADCALDFARHVARQRECTLLRLQYSATPKPADRAAGESLLTALIREACFYDAIVYISDAHEAIAAREFPLGYAHDLARETGTVLLIAATRPEFDSRPRRIVLHDASPELRTQVWRAAIADLYERRNVPASPENLETLARELADRFQLGPETIRTTVARLDQDSSGKNFVARDWQHAIYQAARHNARRALGDVAVRIAARVPRSALILPENVEREFNEFISHIRHHTHVMHAWGFAANLAYGRGPAALFVGPPGTGKTLAAECLATELELDLYKIDVSRIVDKYIGETEKNLGKIFDEAAAAGGVLFFDEADTLFAKRTEISDARDRYANVETGFLLQKIEEYEGPVILASNLRENIDEAFFRRIRFVLEFEFPDEAGRLRLWRALFPQAVPLAADVDFAALAAKIAVPGGVIKNIALRAAFLAITETESKVVSMRHIITSARREYAKIGRLWTE